MNQTTFHRIIEVGNERQVLTRTAPRRADSVLADIDAKKVLETKEPGCNRAQKGDDNCETDKGTLAETPETLQTETEKQTITKIERKTRHMVPRIKANNQGEVFKFQNEGDRIDANYIARRITKTKKQEAAAVLDCDIIESVTVDDKGVETAGPTGPRSVFESKHVQQLLDRANLQPGDRFRLCYDKEGKGGFKVFGFEKVSE